jgi:hypothetical protein
MGGADTGVFWHEKLLEFEGEYAECDAAFVEFDGGVDQLNGLRERYGGIKGSTNLTDLDSAVRVQVLNNGLI